MRENFVQLLAVILEKRGVQQSNVENCMWSLEALRGATKREGLAPSAHDGDGEEGIDGHGATFDHSRCADCSYGYAMACDCMSHLSALQKQANEANSRLQLLVEARERMMESNELISQLDANPELRNTLIAQATSSSNNFNMSNGNGSDLTSSSSGHAAANSSSGNDSSRNNNDKGSNGVSRRPGDDNSNNNNSENNSHAKEKEGRDEIGSEAIMLSFSSHPDNDNNKDGNGDTLQHQNDDHIASDNLDYPSIAQYQ